MKINLIYASASGNVEIVAEQIASYLQTKKVQLTVSRAEQTSIEEILKNNKFVFATSTWEHGKLNPFFSKLYEEMKVSNFKGKYAAFVGLGDTRYEPVLFCEGIQIVRDLWLDHGGEEIGSMLKIQGEPYSKLQSVVDPWSDMLYKHLKFYD